MKRLLKMLAILLVILFLTACGGGGSGDNSNFIEPDTGNENTPSIVDKGLLPITDEDPPVINYFSGKIFMGEMENGKSSHQVEIFLTEDGMVSGLLRDGEYFSISLYQLDRISVFSDQVGWGEGRILDASASFEDRKITDNNVVKIEIPNVSFMDEVYWSVTDKEGSEYFLDRGEWDYDAPEDMDIVFLENGNIQYGEPEKIQFVVINNDNGLANIEINMPANILFGFLLNGLAIHNIDPETVFHFQWSSNEFFEDYGWAPRFPELFPDGELFQLGTGWTHWNEEKAVLKIYIFDVPRKDTGTISGYFELDNEVVQIWIDLEAGYQVPDDVIFSPLEGAVSWDLTLDD